MTKTRDLADLGGGFIQAGTGAVQRTVESKLQDVVSVKDFGARGDGLGTTPADEGVDITNASWNTWDGTNYKDGFEGDTSWSPFYANAQGIFLPPRAKPFDNNDTWDFIGIQLALWSQKKNTYLPPGTYVINVGRDGGGLNIMKGYEQTILGAGSYWSKLVTKENAAFFNAGNQGDNYYNILQLYRTGGPPTIISDIGFIGPDNYNVNAVNLTLINMLNVNGITVKDIWLSSGAYGIKTGTNSGEVFLRSITSEYVFNSTFFCDNTSNLFVDFCNIVSSVQAVLTTQRGIVANGYSQITNTRFQGFKGKSAILASGIFSNNEVTSFGGVGGVQFTNKCIVNNNFIEGDPVGALVDLGSDCTFVGNRVSNIGSTGPCINVGDYTNNNSATNITISGNIVKSTANVIPIQGMTPVSTNLAASSSVTIHDNIIDGPTTQIFVGQADMQGNINNGAPMLNSVTSNERGLFGTTTAPVWATAERVIIGASGSTNNNLVLINDGSQDLKISGVQAALASKGIGFTTNNRIYVYSNADTSTGVYMTAGDTSWSSTSDERTKENLVEITDGLNKVSTLRAVTGNYTNDESQISRSFLIAQDVQSVLPEAVDDTNPDELGLSYTAVIPLLVSALKEAKERIETLEANLSIT